MRPISFLGDELKLPTMNTIIFRKQLKITLTVFVKELETLKTFVNKALFIKACTDSNLSVAYS